MVGSTDAPDSPHLRALSRLGRQSAHTFELVPDAAERAALQGELDLLGLRKLRFVGTLAPEGRKDWRLTATLGATVVQPCARSLDPVTTRIDSPVHRIYSEEYRDPDEAETESPEDDSQEPLPDSLDLAEVLREALALALPDFPVADGSTFAETTVAPPGVAPITSADLNPFQALRALKDGSADKA